MVTIKTPTEIKKLRAGGRHLALVLEKVALLVRPGISARVLDTKAAEFIEKFGDKPSYLGYTPAGSKRPYPATSCISINDEIVHGIPNEREKILDEGDIVGIDIGLIHKGVFLDAALTVPVGSIDPIAKRLIKITKEALNEGMQAARGGGHVGDIGFAIESFVRGKGFTITEGLCGHGVGRAVHEEPYVQNTGARGSGHPLEPGMVLAIEPMLNEGTSAIKLDKDGYTYRTRDRKRSAHFEHTVLITEGKAEVLTEDK